MLQRALNRVAQLGKPERLHQVIVGVEAKRFNRVVHVRASGDDDDLGQVVAGTCCLQQLHAGAVREHQIGHDRVERDGADQLQRLPCRGREADLEALWQIQEDFIRECPEVSVRIVNIAPVEFQDRYAEAITDALYANLPPGTFPRLILESGRALVDEAGWLVTTVFATKRLPDGRRAYVADAGLNDLFTSFWYRFEIEVDRELQGVNEPSMVNGPLCMNIDVLDEVAEYADIIQVGARNMQNYPLLRLAGRSGKPVLLKRGMSATIDELLLAAEYVLHEGNPNVILCERGVRSFDPHTRNLLDLTAIPVVKALSHLPIIADPSHGTGLRSKVTPMARAAVAAGADGIMVEVHPEPDSALSDGPQSLTLEMFAGMAPVLQQVRAQVGGLVAHEG